MFVRPWVPARCALDSLGPLVYLVKERIASACFYDTEHKFSISLPLVSTVFAFRKSVVCQETKDDKDRYRPSNVWAGVTT